MVAVTSVQLKEVGRQTFRHAKERDLPGMAQQMAYNVLFALGPLLIFLTAFAGFVTKQVNSDAQNPVTPVTNWMSANLPGEAALFLREPVERALATSGGFMLWFGALLALWGARNAMSVLMKGLNQALGVEETRSWRKQQGIALGLTLVLAAMLAISSLLYVLGTTVGMDLANAIGLGSVWATVSVWLRWPVIAVVIVVAVTLLHRIAPDHSAPIRWYVPGAVLTVVLWVLSLFGLRLYFAVSDSYAEAYGVFGAVLTFVFWLFVMALVVLIGGVVNAAVQETLPTASRDAEGFDRHAQSGRAAV